ncbi:putative Lipoprotein [Pseudomonas syringae pv. delphinii]|uniref:Putative Lipoprotein n=1 Tax=Pseudomonas syringae pv. delphinii TaxID=192088 RepID=A0A0P9Q6U5_9PSED|nr:putative Lipoprotein [Pseudomonas syringae pv. delphinii]RMP11143.1 putative Lipoprotein [Pseudomonas syringae pv. delphinii]
MGRIPRHFGYPAQPQNSPAFWPVRATLITIGFLQCGQTGTTGLGCGFVVAGLRGFFVRLVGLLLPGCVGSDNSVSGAAEGLS